MCLFALAFLLGDLCLQCFSHLPGNVFIFALLVSSLSLALIIKKYIRYRYLLLAFTFGFAFSAWYASTILAWVLPKELEGRPLLVTGIIASLPAKDQWQHHFLFALEKLQYANTILPGKTIIKLSWRDRNQLLKVGDKWQFYVRLKRIHAIQNPGSLDFEAWALQNGVRAKGYILPSENNILLAHVWYRYLINQVRQALQAKIQTHLPKSYTAPWLMALIMGERNGFTSADWRVLRNTGTNHLMAIAGLHIGIMAGLVSMLVTMLCKRLPLLLLRIPAQRVGAYAALITALLYSLLAGFSIPAQRACIMFSLFILIFLTKRKINPWHPWAMALFIVLLINPLTVLSQSFWLSFMTIALIIYGMQGRLSPASIWWKWARIQWVIVIGLIPFTLLFFQEYSLVSFFANSLAIPWLEFLILPLCLLSTVFIFIIPSIATFLLFIADKNLGLLWTLLTWVSQLPFASLTKSMPSMGIFFFASIGILLFLLPRGVPGKWLGIVWLMPLFFYKPSVPETGEFWLTLLDVGQGLSIVIQTEKHVLVYDAGPKYGATADRGESVVLPFLHTIGAHKIDMLVISHGDNDHIGGAQALLSALPIKMIKTSVPMKILTQFSSYCLAGYEWQWDNVKFKFLYPSLQNLNLNNDSSCVLLISNQIQTILLTGDIEKQAETNLLNLSNQLHATVLVAPHHGSKTSGLKEFISAVQPQFVLYATGYRNRYHFPHASVIHSYAKMQAQQFNTAETGAIQFKMNPLKEIATPMQYRLLMKRYWYDR